MALTKIQAAGLTADLIDETKLADDSIDSEHYNPASIDNEHLADDAVGIDELSATGTAGNTTYLRGDNTWTVPPDTNTTYSVGDGGLTQNNFTNTLKTKLDGIEASATADQTGAQIKTAYEAESDTNAFTDADHTKLDGIAASANNYTHPNHSGEVTSTADGAQVVADDVIDEANLKVDNSPTNDYVLTAKSSAAGGLTWAAASGGISDVVSDTSPQLGGDLDVNGNQIKGDDIQLHAADDQVIAKFHKTNSSEFNFNGSKKLEVTNTGIGVTGSITFSSGGLYLGGAGGSNYLNDYEKGSWDATCDNSVTLTHDELFYTKVGRLVHVCGYLTVNSDNSNTSFIVNNLPFTANSGFGLSAPFVRAYNWNIDSDCKWIAGYTEANKIYFQQVKDDATNTALAADSGGNLILSLTYYQN